MTKSILLRTALYLMLMTITSLFAAGIELTNVGTRATAMGGSYRSIADDWSAMYWNPAGLAFTDGWRAGLGIEYVMPRGTFKAGDSHYYKEHNDSAFKRFSVAFQTERSGEPIDFVVPAAGVSYSTGKWAFGIGLWVPMAWGAKWDVLETAINQPQGRPVPFDDYKGYNAAYPKFEYESDIQIVDIHPTISRKLSDRLSVGVGASILLGKLGLRQPAFLQNPYLYNETLYQYLQYKLEESQLATLEQMRKPPFDHLINEVEMQSEGTSFGANAGIMYKPIDDLSIGATFQYFTDFKPSGDYRQTTYFADAPEYQKLAENTYEIIDKLLKAGQIDSQQYLIVSDFYSGDVVNIVDTEATVTVPLPMKVGLGISYSGLSNVLLAVDVNYTQWSAWDVIKIKDTTGETISQLAQNWDNTFKLGVGAEYKAGQLTLRGGFTTENRAATDKTVSPSIPEIGRRNNVYLGLSMPVGPFAVSLNYERIFIDDKEILTWSYDNMLVAENVAGIYTMNVNNLMIGVDYRF